MELRELHYIATIGRTRHMTTAAQELYISQTALYKSLRKIEAERLKVRKYKWNNKDRHKQAHQADI